MSWGFCNYGDDRKRERNKVCVSDDDVMFDNWNVFSNDRVMQRYMNSEYKYMRELGK